MLYPNREQSNKLGLYKHQINQDIGCFKIFPRKRRRQNLNMQSHSLSLNATQMAKRKIHLTLGLESNLISCPEALLVTPRRSFFSVLISFFLPKPAYDLHDSYVELL